MWLLLKINVKRKFTPVNVLNHIQSLLLCTFIDITAFFFKIKVVEKNTVIILEDIDDAAFVHLRCFTCRTAASWCGVTALWDTTWLTLWTKKKIKLKKDVVPPIPFSSCKISSTRIVNERLAVAMVTTCTDTELRTQNASQLSLSHATNLIWIKHKFTEEGFNLFNPNDHCAALMAPRCTISCFSWKKKTKGFLGHS